MPLGRLLDTTITQLDDLQKQLHAKDAKVRLVIPDSCATFGLSCGNLIESFRAVRNNPVFNASGLGSISTQFPANTAICDISFHFSGGDLSEEDGVYAESEPSVDSKSETEVIELQIKLYIWTYMQQTL